MSTAFSSSEERYVDEAPIPIARSETFTSEASLAVVEIEIGFLRPSPPIRAGNVASAHVSSLILCFNSAAKAFLKSSELLVTRLEVMGDDVRDWSKYSTLQAPVVTRRS